MMPRSLIELDIAKTCSQSVLSVGTVGCTADRVGSSFRFGKADLPKGKRGSELYNWGRRVNDHERWPGGRGRPSQEPRAAVQPPLMARGHTSRGCRGSCGSPVYSREGLRILNQIILLQSPALPSFAKTKNITLIPWLKSDFQPHSQGHVGSRLRVGVVSLGSRRSRVSRAPRTDSERGVFSLRGAFRPARRFTADSVGLNWRAGQHFKDTVNNSARQWRHDTLATY